MRRNRCITCSKREHCLRAAIMIKGGCQDWERRTYKQILAECKFTRVNDRKEDRQDEQEGA